MQTNGSGLLADKSSMVSFKIASFSIESETYPSTEYTKWEGGEQNIGCIGSTCTETDGIVAVTNYVASSDSVSVNWNAIDKENTLPYICQSKCPYGYTWFKGIQRCLKIVHKENEVNLGDALFQCSKNNGRLVSFKSCQEMTDYMDEIYLELSRDNEEYFVGNFIFKDPEFSSYRNWMETEMTNS